MADEQQQPVNAGGDEETATPVQEDQGPNNEVEGEGEKAVEVNSTPRKQMKALVLTGFGGIKVVKIRKFPEPVPKPGEVTVRVKCCGLSFQDLMVRQGVTEKPHKTPTVMGFECTGEIEALGEEVTGFNVGDRVVGFTEFGAWSQLVTIPVQFVYQMPSAMTFQDGAAIPLSYLTAYMLLFEMGNLKSGQSVLAHSIGGGVGTAITQLCQTVGDVTLFGTASNSKHDNIKESVSHLFDHVVDYSQEVRKAAPSGIDLVLDSLCGEDVNKGMGLLKPMGKYILYGSSNIVTGETKSFFSFAKSWWQVDKVSPIKLYDDNHSMSGFNLRHLLFHQGRHEYVRDIMDKIFNLYNSSKIKPKIDSTFAFEDVGEAMQRMHDRKNIGKIILDPTMEPKPKPEPKKTPSKSAPKHENPEGEEENNKETGSD